MRNILVHIHLPKTGGSTLNAILKREFGRNYYGLSIFQSKKPDESGNKNICWNQIGKTCRISDLVPVWHFDALDIFDMLERNSDAVVISRHGILLDPTHLRPVETCRQNKKYNLFPIFFLRNHLVWHMSLYFQQRRDPDYIVRHSQDPRVIVAKTGSLEEYTKFCVDNAADLQYHKIMHNWTESETEKMLCNIKLYQIGITERYNESLVVIEDILTEHFLGIDLSYADQVNVDQYRRNYTVHDNISEMRKQIGVKLMKKFSRIHMNSSKLYDAINTELDCRISRIPDFEQKLDDFERRCKRRSITS